MSITPRACLDVNCLPVSSTTGWNDPFPSPHPTIHPPDRHRSHWGSPFLQRLAHQRQERVHPKTEMIWRGTRAKHHQSHRPLRCQEPRQPIASAMSPRPNGTAARLPITEALSPRRQVVHNPLVRQLSSCPIQHYHQTHTPFPRTILLGAIVISNPIRPLPNPSISRESRAMPIRSAGPTHQENPIRRTCFPSIRDFCGRGGQSLLPTRWTSDPVP